MNADSLNPYESPRTSSLNVLVGRSDRLSITLVGIATVIYLVFTAILLTATASDDRIAGRLFLLNLPILGLWCLVVLRRRKWASMVSFAAIGIQVGIASMMLGLLKNGDLAAILGINGAFALGFAVLGLVTQWLSRSKRNA